WARLVSDLGRLYPAWAVTGDLAKDIAPFSVLSDARQAARVIQRAVLDEHHRTGGYFDVRSNDWALRCQNLAQWWRLTASEDVRRGRPMRRCRHCGTWFSLGRTRIDAGFCSPAHRSAFHQKRRPASQFWAEAI